MKARVHALTCVKGSAFFVTKFRSLRADFRGVLLQTSLHSAEKKSVDCSRRSMMALEALPIRCRGVFCSVIGDVGRHHKWILSASGLTRRDRLRLGVLPDLNATSARGQRSNFLILLCGNKSRDTAGYQIIMDTFSVALRKGMLMYKMCCTS